MNTPALGLCHRCGTPVVALPHPSPASTERPPDLFDVIPRATAGPLTDRDLVLVSVTGVDSVSPSPYSVVVRPHSCPREVEREHDVARTVTVAARGGPSPASRLADRRDWILLGEIRTRAELIRAQRDGRLPVRPGRVPHSPIEVSADVARALKLSPGRCLVCSLSLRPPNSEPADGPSAATRLVAARTELGEPGTDAAVELFVHAGPCPKRRNV